MPAKFEIVDINGADDRYNHYPDDDDDQGGLPEYWRILRRRTGVLVLGAALGLLVGAALTLPQTPIYKAMATLELQSLNRDFMNIGSIQQTTDNNGWDGMLDLQTQIQILQSRTLVQAVARDLKAKLVEPGLQPQDEVSRLSTWRRALNLPEASAQDVKDRAVSMPAGTLSVKGGGQTRIVEVSADSTDPKVAAAFVNLLTEKYVQQSMDARWESTQQTSEWLDSRLDEMRIKLEGSENALQDYARRNQLLFTDQDTNVDEAKLEQLQVQLTAIEGERVARQSRWEMALTASPETLPDVLDDSTLRGYQQSLSDLRKERQELLETFKPESQPVKRVDAQINSLQQSRDRELQQVVERIRNEYEESLRREGLIKQAYQEQTSLVTDQNGKSIQYGILKREADTNRQLHAAMLGHVQEAELASALKSNNVRVVDLAEAPRFAYKPSVARNSLIGLLLGSILAVGFVLVTERANRTLKEPGDLQYYVGVPELGAIPSAAIVTGGKKIRFPRKAAVQITPDAAGASPDEEASGKFELITLERKLSVVAESFRAALTSIQFSGNGHGAPSVIIVTSPDPGEGKTTVVSNLAISMAETGQRVLLIDGDTRRPRLHDVFGVDNSEGLTTVLRERERDAEAIASWLLDGLIKNTRVEHLDLLPAGQQVAGPFNLFQAKRFSSTLTLLRKTYDTILIDTPPMLHIPDARLFGKLADGVVLVTRAGSTTRDTALAAKLRLFDDGVNLIGAVMNDWNPKEGTSGRYGYYQGYSKYSSTYHDN